MLTREKPTREQVEGYLTERRNWGRWKENPGAGTINLITREKTVQAAGLIKKGRTVSLSRAFPVTPGPGNAKPAHHYVFESKSPTGSHFSMDYIGVAYHGLATTHIDAVCHVYQTDGVMFDGRDSKKEVLFDGAGARFGAVTEWSGGIMTRGVLLDIRSSEGCRTRPSTARSTAGSSRPRRSGKESASDRETPSSSIPGVTRSRETRANGVAMPRSRGSTLHVCRT